MSNNKTLKWRQSQIAMICSAAKRTGGCAPLLRVGGPLGFNARPVCHPVGVLGTPFRYTQVQHPPTHAPHHHTHQHTLTQHPGWFLSTLCWQNAGFATFYRCTILPCILHHNHNTVLYVRVYPTNGIGPAQCVTYCTVVKYCCAQLCRIMLKKSYTTQLVRYYVVNCVQ